MVADYKIIKETDYADSFDERAAFALDVLVGLCETNKRLPSKYLYDRRGSELFQQITELDEYYPSACELEILKEQVNSFLDHVGEGPFNLVELGAGSGPKTEVLIRHFQDLGLEFQYVPIDISESAMAGLVETLGKQFPGIHTHGLVTDYFNGLKWLNNRYQRRNFVVFLGSSIGNFTHAESRIFLRNVWNCLNDEDVFATGFDLKKDIEMLLHAYNDAKGVTAEFNLNILRRINDELGGRFDLSKFRHFGTYNVFSGGMESFLVSLERQSVFIEMIGRSFVFKPWEPIHTEYSYKYLISDIEDLARETGFTVRTHLFDSNRYFTDSVWSVAKPEIRENE